MWYILKSHIISGLNLFIPKIRLRSRQFPVWFTPQLRHSLKCLRTLQRKFNKHPTPNNYQRLTRSQESFHTSHTAAKSMYEQSLVHNFVTYKDPKIFWFIRDLTKTRALPSQLHDDSTTTATDEGKAELLNQYFYSVFTHSNYTVPDPNNLPIPSNHLDLLVNFTEQYLMHSPISTPIRQVELTTSLQ